MTDSINFGPEWLRNISSDNLSSSSSSGTTSTNSTSYSIISGGRSNNNNSLSTSSSSEVSSIAVPLGSQLTEFRYDREEILSIYDKNMKPPEILPSYKKLYVEKLQCPLALTPKTEDDVITLNATGQQRLWALRSPAIRGTTRGGSINKCGSGRSHNDAFHTSISGYQRPTAKYNDEIRSGMEDGRNIRIGPKPVGVTGERGWPESNSYGSGDWNGPPSYSPRKEFTGGKTSGVNSSGGGNVLKNIGGVQRSFSSIVTTGIGSNTQPSVVNSTKENVSVFVSAPLSMWDFGSTTSMQQQQEIVKPEMKTEQQVIEEKIQPQLQNEKLTSANHCDEMYKFLQPNLLSSDVGNHQYQQDDQQQQKQQQQQNQKIHQFQDESQQHNVQQQQIQNNNIVNKTDSSVVEEFNNNKKENEEKLNRNNQKQLLQLEQQQQQQKQQQQQQQEQQQQEQLIKEHEEPFRKATGKNSTQKKNNKNKLRAKEESKQDEAVEKRKLKEDKKQCQIDDERKRQQQIEEEKHREMMEEEKRQKEINRKRAQFEEYQQANDTKKEISGPSSVAPWSKTGLSEIIILGPNFAEIQKAERERRAAEQVLETQRKTQQLKLAKENSQLKWNVSPLVVKSFAEIQAEESRRLANEKTATEQDRRKQQDNVVTQGTAINQFSAIWNTLNVKSSAWNGNSTASIVAAGNKTCIETNNNNNKNSNNNTNSNNTNSNIINSNNNNINSNNTIVTKFCCDSNTSTSQSGFWEEPTVKILSNHITAALILKSGLESNNSSSIGKKIQQQKQQQKNPTGLSKSRSVSVSSMQSIRKDNISTTQIGGVAKFSTIVNNTNSGNDCIKQPTKTSNIDMKNKK